MNDPELTQQDYEAADEVLRRCPDDGGTADAKREVLARLHACFGRSIFRLYYGLRQPRSAYEKWRYQLYHDEITEEECSENMRQRAERPVDQEMIDELYPQLEALLKDYSRALQAAAATMSSHCSEWERERKEREVTTCLARTTRKFTLDKREMATMSSFLIEMRNETGLGVASGGDLSATTAVELILLVVKRARLAWTKCQETAHRSQTDPRYAYSTTAARLYFGESGPNLPKPQNLTTLLEQERVAATVALRKRAAEAIGPSPLAVSEAVIHVQSAELNLPSLERALAGAKNQQKPPLMTVDRWSELAVGIDERRRAWALSPAPDTGGTFAKSQAKLLELRGNRWKPLFTVLADSSTGDCAPAFEVAQAFDLLPPTTTVNADSRAVPGAIRHATLSELGSRGSAIREELSNILKELGRAFRKKVEGPTGKADACFRLEGDHVRCGFVVRYLLQLGNRTYSFGKRRTQNGG